jgi:hypothetical protein
MAERDPLSVRYDGVVRQLMERARRAERDRKSIQAWIASPRGEFRHRDKGGRTAHERAFMRSAYYLIFRSPINEQKQGRGNGPDWSLKLTWGSDADRRASSQGRTARPVQVRLYRRASARVTGPSWIDDESRRSRIGEDGERIVGG